VITIPAGVRIYLACGVTDMRRGFDGLSILAQDVLKQDPFSGAIFCFRGRRGDLVKILYWDGQGLLPVRQAAGEGPLYLAGDVGRLGYADPGADVDAARRAGMESAASDMAADAGGMIRGLRPHDRAHTNAKQIDARACRSRPTSFPTTLPS
jgi:hypothetical protein